MVKLHKIIYSVFCQTGKPTFKRHRFAEPSNWLFKFDCFYASVPFKSMHKITRKTKEYKKQKKIEEKIHLFFW